MLARRSSSASISRSRASAAARRLTPSRELEQPATTRRRRERTMRSSRGSRAGSSPERIWRRRRRACAGAARRVASVVALPRPRAALAAPAAAAARTLRLLGPPASACFEQLTTYPSQSRSVGGAHRAGGARAERTASRRHALGSFSENLEFSGTGIDGSGHTWPEQVRKTDKMALTAELAGSRRRSSVADGSVRVGRGGLGDRAGRADGRMAQSGVVLCELANALQPAVSKINRQGKMMFKQLENISAFIRATKALGVSATFETNDLYEQNNLVLVVQCLQALKDQTTARGGAGAGLGSSAPPVADARREVRFGRADVAAPAGGAAADGRARSVAAVGYCKRRRRGRRGGWGINADLEAKKRKSTRSSPRCSSSHHVRGARVPPVSRAPSRARSGGDRGVGRRDRWRRCSAAPGPEALAGGCATARSSARPRMRSAGRGAQSRRQDQIQADENCRRS